MKAIVFDFNGTMFMDTDKHRLAWNEFFAKMIGRPLTEEEFRVYACGPGVDTIIRRFYHCLLYTSTDGARNGRQSRIRSPRP